MTTLQNKLIKALTAIKSLPNSATDSRRLAACLQALKEPKIDNDDYIKTLVFINLLLKELPAASIHSKPLQSLYKHCRLHLEAPQEEYVPKNKLRKR